MKRKVSFVLALFLMMFLFPVFNKQEVVRADNTVNEVIYKQVKSTDELSIGDKIVIAAKDHKFAMSTTDNGKTRGQTKILKYTEGNDTYIVLNEQTQIIELGYSYGGAYQLKVGNQYLIGATDTESALSTKLSIGSYITAYWNITINENGSATIKSMKYYIENIVRYNPIEQIFGAYPTETSESEVAVFIECPDAPIHTHKTSISYDENIHTEMCYGCDEVIKQEPHNYIEEVVESTCSKQGYTTYTCDCGYSYVGNYTEEKAHNFMPTTYVWNDTYTECTATRVCEHDSSHIEEETVKSEVTVIDPACGTEGSKIYKVTFTNEAFESQTYVETIKALTHSYSEVTYKWNDTYTECTATRVCEHDSSHIEEETAKSEVTVIDPACGQEGSKTYKVTFINEAFESQIVTEVIKALSHSYDEGVISKEPTTQEYGEKTFTCGNCGNTYTEVIDKLPIEDNSVIEPVGQGIITIEDIIDKHPIATTLISVSSISLLSVLGIILKFLKIK